MKTFSILEKLNKKNRLLFVSCVVFAVSLFVNAFLHFSALLYISGFFLALYIPGLALKNILDPKENLLSSLLTAPIFTIFFFIPAYFGITKLLHGQINFFVATATLTGMVLFSFLKTCTNDDPQEESTGDGKYLFFGIGVFTLVHILSTMAYRFIPEIDGYSTLVKIESIISSGIFDASYRPLFSFLMSYTALLSHIPPYFLFKFGMVFIQVTGVYYLYRLTKKAGIKSPLVKYLILLSFASIPIINVEIDYVRPQVIFILAVLPFLHYLSEGISGQKKNLIFSTVIATAGLFFHEFFGILFLINIFFIVRYFYKKQNNVNKLLSWLIAVIGTFILLVNIHRFPLLLFFLNSAQQFIKLIGDGIDFKWWFLETYSNMDGNNLGWIGPTDVMKYYAYSLSPMLIVILFAYPVILWNKIKKNETVFCAEKISLFLACSGLFSAEILPRINYPTLPDRFWPIISLSLLALAPFTLSRIKLLGRKAIIFLLFALILIGITGSLYITRAKSGYTSNKEYVAAIWIKNNTPENALFITQGGNGPMIDYFAKRKAIYPPQSFFLNTNKQESEPEIPKSKKAYQDAIALFNASLNNPNSDNLSLLNINLKKYHEEVEKEKLVKNYEILDYKLPRDKDVYVLYSLDKFNNYYGQRKWWRTANFFGANLNKFKEGYELIYNDSNTIYIWKKQ